MRLTRSSALLTIFSVAACGQAGAPASSLSPLAPAAAQTFTAIPIPAMTPADSYMGLEGGLPDPDDPKAPRPNGKIVLLSIGFSTTESIFRQFQSEYVGAVTPAGKSTLPKETYRVETDSLVLVNGARGGGEAEDWIASKSKRGRATPFEEARERLLPYTEADVDWVWMMVANRVDPRKPLPPTLPDSGADAWMVAANCATMVDLVRQRYPNVTRIYVSAKQYTGYSTANAAEPYSYENGFGARACVMDQLGVHHGPYLWDPTWPKNYYERDGVHLRLTGAQRASALLHAFFAEERLYSP